jgi:DNA-binding CsgD family transcriptional regulator
LAALLDGDPGTALRHLEDGVLTLRQGTVASAAAWWGIWVVLRTAADGTVPLPGPEFELAQVHAANVVALGYARAIAAAAVGDTEASVREMASADVLADPMPHWANLMRLLASQAALQGGWGDPVGWLRGCLAHFETREPLFATLARELLRRAGAPVPRRRQGAGTVPEWLRAAGITGREMEVLHLLGENLTNAEIGRRLFLSPRTVETHVKHLMEKLGTNRRSELAAAAGRRRPGPPFRSPPGGVRAPAS